MSEKGSILIIDDDRHILEMLTQILSKEGYAVETSETGAEAIRKVKEKYFNIALIDIVLPDLQGTQLLTELRSHTPKTRKIIITGHATLNNAVEALNLGADTYIMKPVDPQALISIIEEQLRQQREEETMTQEKIMEFINANKDNFVEMMKQSLNSFFGESAAKAICYHLEKEERISDPNIYVERLRTLFKDGAEIILRHVLKQMEASSKTPPKRMPKKKVIPLRVA